MPWELFVEEEELEKMNEKIELELLERRIINLCGEISSRDVDEIIAKTVYIRAKDPDLPIVLNICSEGGSVAAGLGICDLVEATRQFHTYAVGQVMSMALTIFVCGKKRFALHNARFMIHSVSITNVEGGAGEIQSQGEETTRLQEVYQEILHEHTCIPDNVLERSKYRPVFFGAEQALLWGVCDEIVGQWTTLSLRKKGEGGQ